MQDVTDRQHSVLIVEDEKLVRWFMTKELSKRGYLVESVASGESALEELKQKPYDVVITDLRLEGMDGLQVAATVRELAPSAKVIVFTAYGTPEVEERASACGVFRFMHKPLEMELVASIVRAAVQVGRPPTGPVNRENDGCH